MGVRSLCGKDNQRAMLAPSERQRLQQRFSASKQAVPLTDRGFMNNPG